MGLETTNGRNQHCRVGSNARVTTLDVEETLGAHVGAEAGFGEQEVTGMDADLVGNNRAVAGGDIAERAGVHQCGLTFERLHQVRFDGFFKMTAIEPQP